MKCPQCHKRMGKKQYCNKCRCYFPTEEQIYEEGEKLRSSRTTEFRKMKVKEEDYTIPEVRTINFEPDPLERFL